MKDKKGGLAKTHKKSIEDIRNFSEGMDRIVWRALNPELSGMIYLEDKTTDITLADSISFLLVNALFVTQLIQI